MFNASTFIKLLDEAEKSGIFNKAVVGFLLNDGTKHILSLNTQEDSIFDIASLTKVCPTSTLALKYILENKLSIDSKVVDFIPELQTNYRNDIRIFHLLTHTLDYRVPMKSLRSLPPKEILNALYTYQFSKAPGEDFNYGNPASVLLGIILNRLTKKSLQELGNEFLFKPLGMNKSGWDPLLHFEKKEIIPTEICNFRNREIQGEIHDESAWVLRELFQVGSAGMFSTIPDLLKFTQMILNDGVDVNSASKTRIIPPGILDLVSHNAFERIDSKKYSSTKNACTALGWELNSSKFMGTKCSSKTFGKTGFTGASIIADSEKGAAVILLSNFTYPHREENADRINAFRAKLADTFFEQQS